MAGKRLVDANIRKATDVLVIAICDREGNYTYNPGPETILSENAILIVLGSMETILRLRESVTGKARSVSLIPGVHDRRPE